MLSSLVYHLKRPYHFLKTGVLNGIPAQLWYRNPQKKLKIIAITGTDGKTSSSTLLYSVLKANGKKVGLISTVAAYLGDEEVDTGFHVTAPRPWDVFQLMRRMVKENYEYLVLETTSHGIYQYRTWGITPSIAGLTNITHEHLDYHLTYDNYVAAKALLFKRAATVVLNKDDHSFFKVKKLLSGHRDIEDYSLSEALSPLLAKTITQKFPEIYNQYNARLVTKIAEVVGLTDKEIVKGLKAFSGVKGRLQKVPNRLGFNIVVDFAHTPNALEGVLTTLKSKNKVQSKPGKLIAIFGCAGLRDHQKRPMMAEIATRLADKVIFTAEDPRTEDVWSIIRQMKEQLTPPAHRKILSIVDRGEAIYFALTKIAQPGDWIAVLGKGHEHSMCYGTTEYPWNDVDAINQMLPHIKKVTHVTNTT